MSGSVLLLPVFVPVAAGIAMLNITKMKERKVRDCYVGAVLAFSLIVVAMLFFYQGDCAFQAKLGSFLFVLRLDGLAKVFSALVSVAWILNGFFAFEYMSKEENQVQFLSFYLRTGGLLTGIAYAGGYSTMKLFYILASFTCIPLIIHRQTEDAVHAAMYYAAYFLMGLIGIQIGGHYVMKFVTSKEFVAGGSLDMEAAAGHQGMFLFLVFLLLLGFGIKACLFPFHGWHKVAAGAAPLPGTIAISAIMTKIGVIAMFRLIGNVIGTEILKETWVQYIWMVLALLSIFIGAVLAFKTDFLAERMAYSTIGQVGWIVFGVSLMNSQAVTGALVLMISHTMATLVLFFATGAIVFRTGYTRVSELRGIGRKLPGMLLLFTLASFVIMGIPPTLGFVGDWNVSLGALAVHIPYLASVGSCVFVIGELFAAGYLMGIMIRGFFPGEDYHSDSEEAFEPSLFMRFPAVLLTMAVYIIGFYPVPLLELIQRALEAMAI